MATKYNNRVKFPRENFVLRVIEEVFGMSKGKENPMITLKFEVDRPEEVNIGGEDYTVAGTQITNYYTTIVLNGEGDLADKTRKAQENVVKLYEAFGLVPKNSTVENSGINFENPKLGFKGKLVWALCYPDEQPQRKSPTKEQLAKGIKQGDIIMDPILKIPVVSYYPKIDRIYGLADNNVNKPF